METYRAAVASAFDKVAPLDTLRVTEVSVPDVPPGWTRVRVRTASVNQHDVLHQDLILTLGLTRTDADA